MKKWHRVGMHLISLVLFLAITAFAFYRAPPAFSSIQPGWLACALGISALAVLLQAIQIQVFLRQEQKAVRMAWSLWFTAEKAWLNSIFPAKAGTVGSLFVLQRNMGLSWLRYTRFMLLCGVFAIGASVAGLLILLLSPVEALVIVAVGTVATGIASRWLYRLRVFPIVMLFLVAGGNLLLMSLGIGVCILGLGHQVAWMDTLPIGVALNVLSVASFTPGNFGVREVVLSALTPMMPIPFATLIQGSSCYVIARLVSSLALASITRDIDSAGPLKNAG